MTDYTCRISAADDTPAVRQLYELVFNDSPHFTERFFSKIYRPNNTVVVEYDGQIIAAGMLIGYQSQLQQKRYKCGYLYALMTHPDHRRRGCMHQIIDMLEKRARQRKYHFLFLVNATDELRDIYRRFGFLPVGTQTLQTIDIESFPVQHIETMNVIHRQVADALYTKNYNGILHTPTQMKFDLETLSDEGGQAVEVSYGFQSAMVLGKPIGNSIYRVVLSIGNKPLLENTLIALARQNQCTRLQFFTQLPDPELSTYGMAKSLSTGISMQQLRRLQIRLVMDL